MKLFANLFQQLDRTTKTTVKVKSLAKYFDTASDTDKVWTIALFTHRRPKRNVKTSLLREWAAEYAGIPLWLFEESYHIVGDLAEAISLIIDDSQQAMDKSLTTYIEELIDLKDKEEHVKKEYVLKAWNSMNQTERFLFNKLLTGGFRIGVSSKLIVKALSKSTGQEENVISHRLMGNWDPSTISFEDLILSESGLDEISKPYPFYLAYALEAEPEDLGATDEWQAEYKWDGIRGQLILRDGELFVWSRGEELVTDKYPEYEKLKDYLPDNIVIDGEILAYIDGKPLSFNMLQKRIGRKKVGKKLLQDCPVILMAYDILEYQGKDLRSKSTQERRDILNGICKNLPQEAPIRISPTIEFADWDVLKELRSKSRALDCEGIMLKRKSSEYKIGRKKGDWWKWKVDPMNVDAVMIYAQRGHGRRANLFTDFTFAVRNEEGGLVPFAKAYSGLTDKEFKEITSWVKKNTRERFGPVCSVHPELVFELAFEGIARSTRHKSGIALRFPRILRWRKDKNPNEINTLEDLENLLTK